MNNAKKQPWRPLKWLGTGFGLGYSPIASGTVGSFWGLLIVLGLFPFFSVAGEIIIALLLTLLAFPVCGAADKFFDKKDDGRIVADEFMTFPICMVGLPLTWEQWWVLPMAFVSCRICDIIKPFPAYRLQKLPGGIGITIDDVIASLYSLGINHLLYWIINTYA